MIGDIMTTVDWSRWQFALTAIYHWLFVPLTLGLSVIVAVMESIYVRNGKEEWLEMTKFWMRLFGINFAIGVATGLILEFEFGTNWSNYSWFVGDIFGAPLAIEGLLAFFMESTFVAVMFFGWGKVGKKFHLAATWLTAIGASISALWILVANAWMQYPAGMEFDPEQMRNVMNDFWALFSPIAVNKFFHAVFSGWALAGVFVIGVSAYFFLKGKHRKMALASVKTGGWVGLAGILMTMWTGDGSAVQVAEKQPMKLAAMEGLYRGEEGQGIVAFGILNPKKTIYNDEKEYLFDITLPGGLAFLARRDFNAFVPGINDILEGKDIVNGKPVNTVSYPERMALGKESQDWLRAYGEAREAGDTRAERTALNNFRAGYPYFGYGYFDNESEAVPPVAMTFYSFHLMVILGGYFLLLIAVALLLAYIRPEWLEKKRWLQWIAILSVPLMWVCSESGWVVAEVGRQPWTVQDLLPTCAAVSDISGGSVMFTFWMFALVFTLLLVAEVSIMTKQIKKY